MSATQISRTALAAVSRMSSWIGRWTALFGAYAVVLLAQIPEAAPQQHATNAFASNFNGNSEPVAVKIFSTAQQEEPLFEYAAKIVCGIQQDPKDMRLARGFYATTINIHNPNKEPAKFFKKLALTYPPEEQRPGKIMPISDDVLQYDEALKVDCNDLEKRLFPNGFPTPYLEGFVIIQSNQSLDVTAVYSTAMLDKKGRVTEHSSIDVEQIRERSRKEDPKQFPDLIPVRGQQGFCELREGKLVVTVRNQGAGPSAPSTTEVEFSTIGGTSVKVQLPTPSLAPGASVELLFDIPPGCFVPDCFFKITVDATGVVPETNEANNTASDNCLG